MAKKYTKTGVRTDGDHTVRPSERMFRRSRAAEDRRIRSMNKDARFFRFVFGIASVGTFIVFLIIVFMSKAYAQDADAPQIASEGRTTALTRPILGDFSSLDIMGVAFVIFAGYAVYRKYKR